MNYDRESDIRAFNSPRMRCAPPRRARRAMVMVIVAVVILLISLAGYGFLMLMQTENKAARARGDQLQAEAVAASGREFLAAILELPRSQRPVMAEFDDVPELFGGVLVDGDPDEDEEASRQGRFAVIVGQYSEMAARAWRFGYENESTKLNLARLVEWDRRQPGLGREALMNLPNMDESTAEAILDWIDRDDQSRDLGAEADYYMGLDPPRRPRNGVPSSLEELLLVRGVTREKLFGYDLNANFSVDAWESDLAETQAASGTDARIPWSRFLTVRSGERDESFDGTPRIQLNQPNLAKLHRELAKAFDSTWASFIVAYRQHGPYRGAGKSQDPANLPLDLSQPGTRRIRSPLDLIGVRVAISVGSSKNKKKKKKQVFASPFSADPVEMREYLSRLMDQVTVGDGSPIFGRVNINLASREVLASVPGVDLALAERILSARTLTAVDDPKGRHAAWLLLEGVVERSVMRKLEPYVTTGGDIGRAQVIGYYDSRSPLTRYDTVVDGTSKPARQVYYKDLRRLGRGPLEDVINVTRGP